MSNTKTYLNILLDSLQSKENILNNIHEITKKQQELINNEELDLEEFDNLLKEKQQFIDQIELLDQGFQSTFDRISKELQESSTLYQDEIKTLKKNITDISNLGISIQILEEKNKVKIEEHFASKKRKVKSFKKSNNTVANYYKSMNNNLKEESYFLDKKK